jgi:hypothetical protein
VTALTRINPAKVTEKTEEHKKEHMSTLNDWEGAKVISGHWHNGHKQCREKAHTSIEMLGH